MIQYLESSKEYYQDLCDRVLQNELLVKVIILANLGGTLFGFYWYRGLLESTPVYLWPLVPDSPLSTLMISISLLLYLYENSNRIVDALAFFGNLKYGLWTVFVELYMFESFLALNSLPMYFFITFSHLIMFLQAFLVLRYTEISWKPGILAFMFYIVNDLVDYTSGIYAPLPEEVSIISITSAVAFTLTLAGFLIYSEKLSVESEIGKISGVENILVL